MSLHRIDLDDGKGLVGLSDNWKLPNRLEDVDVSPDGRSVAMVLTAGETSDLFVAGIDGSSLRAVTSDAYFEREPIWNGTGDRIIFQSNRAGQADLWEIDPRSGALNQLTQGETEKIAESTSPDGSIISLQRLSQDAKLWLWTPDAGAAQQLTHDALSDHSPVLSGNGKTLAFQRSQPTPSRGYAILDTKMFVASFDGQGNPREARTIGDGYYRQPVGGRDLARVPPREQLAGEERAGRSQPAQQRLHEPDRQRRTAHLQSEPRRMGGPDDGLDACRRGSVVCRSGRTRWPSAATARPSPSPPPRHRLSKPQGLANGSETCVCRRMTGNWASSPLPKEGVSPRILNLASGAVRQVGNLGAAATGAYLQGFLDGNLVLVRRLNLHENLTSDMEVLVSAGSSGFKPVGVVTNVFVSTTRLHPERRVLYMTRVSDGAHNLAEFSFRTGAMRTITRTPFQGSPTLDSSPWARTASSAFATNGARTSICSNRRRRQDPARLPGAERGTSGSDRSDGSCASTYAADTWRYAERVVTACAWCGWSSRYPGCRTRRGEVTGRRASAHLTRCTAALQRGRYSQPAPGSSAWTRHRRSTGALTTTRQRRPAREVCRKRRTSRAHRT